MISTDYTFTPKQIEALGIMGSGAGNILLPGGTRSGKTFVICRTMLHRLIRYPGARSFIARFRLAHAKATVWAQTMIPMIKEILPPDAYKENKAEGVVRFWNGSELWILGFDDKERVEKVLGSEYLDGYFCEVSQISWYAAELGMTRLAQVVYDQGGRTAINRGFFDCNPPSPRHWSHRLFIEKVDPVTGEPRADPDEFAYLAMNPVDNKANLSEGFLARLDNLSDRTRRRMRDGEWLKPEGAVFDRLGPEHLIDIDKVPPLEFYTAGVDFGLNMAGVLIGWAGENVYVLADYGGYNLTASSFDEAFTEQEIELQFIKEDGEPGETENEVVRYDELDYDAYCDPAGGERIQEITGGVGANNSVEPGLDYINTKLENGELYIVEANCPGLMGEVYDYKRDEQGRIIKENDHYTDAFRYGVFSFGAVGAPSITRI